MNALNVFSAGYTDANIEQNTAEWLAWRSLGLGASDVPTIMGENPYKTPYQLWEVKVGLKEAEDLSNNPNVRRGNDNEDAARNAWMAKTGNFAVPLCLVNKTADWLRVSFDGLTQDTNLEIKCPSQKKLEKARKALDGLATNTISAHKELDSLGFGHYYGQTQYQMLVAGVWKTALWLYDVENPDKSIELQILYNKDYCDKMLEKAEAFWQAIQDVKAPALTDKDVIAVSSLDANVQSDWAAAEKELLAVEAKLAPLAEQVKELEAAKKAAKKALTDLAGDHPRVESDCVKVTQFVRQGSVDWKGLVSDIAPDIPQEEVEKHRRKASAQFRISIK